MTEKTDPQMTEERDPQITQITQIRGEPTAGRRPAGCVRPSTSSERATSISGLSHSAYLALRSRPPAAGLTPCHHLCNLRHLRIL
jgi:hypothetical protein